MKFKIVVIWPVSNGVSEFTSQVFCSEKAAEKSFVKTKKFECKSINHYNQILKANEFDHWYEIHKVIG